MCLWVPERALPESPSLHVCLLVPWGGGDGVGVGKGLGPYLVAEMNDLLVFNLKIYQNKCKSTHKEQNKNLKSRQHPAEVRARPWGELQGQVGPVLISSSWKTP